MEVGIDGRSLTVARGVARYTSSLLGTMTAAAPDVTWRAFLGSRPAAVPVGTEIAVTQDPRPQQLLFAAAALVGRPRLDRLLGGQPDVVWLPAPRPVAVSRTVPYVLTVHDRSWEERPGDFTAYERLWHHLGRPREVARRAARVVCVSQAVADELLAHWPGVDPARVRVVLSGVDPVPAGPPPPPPPRLGGRPYVLSVGALEPRKAPELLAAAYARARREGLDADLVFAGRGRLADALAGPGVHVLQDVDDDELDALCAHALALAMPSWLEGFGLPPLEAARRGTPAVLSDLPVFRETLGDAFVAVPPGDETALATALVRLGSDGALRADVGARAQAAVAELRWERAGATLLGVLREAAEEP